MRTGEDESRFSFYRLQYEAVTASHLLNQTTPDSMANLCKWHRGTIQSLPMPWGCLQGPEPGAAFASLKEFTIGSKLSIQLLQTLRIDFFFFKKYFLHTYSIITSMNGCQQRGQYYFQILLAVRLPAPVSSIIPGLDYSIFGHLQTRNGFFKWKQDWECLTPEPFWLVFSGQCRRGFPAASHSAA